MTTISRRELLGSSVATGAAMLAGARPARARVRWKPDKLNIGMIGTAAQAGWNMGQLAANPSVNIAALCDVDDNLLADALKKHPDAKTYNDFRKLIEDHKGLDAVLVATPDHVHAPATLMALEAGLHVYCEKPLTHTVYEARKVAESAKKHKRITQMGTQIHAGGNYRRVVELVQSGAIGAVTEVHVFCGRQNSANGRPAETPPVPSNLHWDLWLGPAPERPYNPAYVPFHWRWWWDFGGGTLGDMGCHLIDLPKWALKLGAPESVEAEGPTAHPECTAVWIIVRYKFPKREGLSPVDLSWYHGEKRPQVDTGGAMDKFGQGILFVGEKGMLLADYDRRVLLPERDFKDLQPPTPSIPDSIGHHNEWIEAIKTGGPTTCNFEYAGALTEAVLLGNVAYRAGRKLEWDSRHLKAKNCPEAEQYLRPAYREPYRKILVEG